MKQDNGDFVYCLPRNRKDPRSRYDPYDLQVVSPNESRTEKVYWTISASFVTRVRLNRCYLWCCQVIDNRMKVRYVVVRVIEHQVEINGWIFLLWLYDANRLEVNLVSSYTTENTFIESRVILHLTNLFLTNQLCYVKDQLDWWCFLFKMLKRQVHASICRSIICNKLKEMNQSIIRYFRVMYFQFQWFFLSLEVLTIHGTLC